MVATIQLVRVDITAKSAKLMPVAKEDNSWSIS